MVKEGENLERVIIERDSITLEFDQGKGSPNMIIWGKTVDGRSAIYLSEDTDVVSKKAAVKKAAVLLKVLKKDNPSVDFELVNGTSIFAPRGTEALLALGPLVVKALEMMHKGDVKRGHNTVKLAELSPVANTGWNAFWAISNCPLQQLTTANFTQQT